MNEIEAAKRLLLGKVCSDCIWQGMYCTSDQKKTGEQYGTCLAWTPMRVFISRLGKPTGNGRIYPKQLFDKIVKEGRHGI